MRQIADFHIHSKYSRACSRDLTLVNIDAMCRRKGVDIIGTGDFTYPAWFKSIQEELQKISPTPSPSPSLGRENLSDGELYVLRNAVDDKIKFILTSEVALIYKKNNKCRRVHMVIHAPNIEAVAELNKQLDKNYNIRSDGRPILGMSIEKLCEICFAIHPKFLIYPAHIWTPWFAIFGSKSGFDSWEEAFGEYADKIFAYETGLSSDPEMNWRVSGLDKFTLLSNSDAHSLSNIAREANVFELARIDYNEIYNVITKNDTQKSFLDYTIEFYPEEGMYHFDGHRDCGFSSSGDETKRLKCICPKCKKPLILGVDYRVSELADNQQGRKSKGSNGFKKVVGLEKIIAEALNIKNRNSKKVQSIYNEMINTLGSELKILIDLPIAEIQSAALPSIALGIERARSGNLIIQPGFDGQYGVVKIFSEEEKVVQKKML
ncbi:MAG: PHP domain protein [Candidatus Falkowbacteria bacterium GW2011_GWC2_38_22]|uniref:PHP domain protein n=1 Tax=Candidatus Falkowbacteria bacterium GW2011_GWE1_38_31 TaxID=1618638 RepID=A0A0G0M950_9BACT|nr:MAG: PHP domain protein [Candidatus Falkowbacteria bacterium GW2011_GWF2_38_1205]KKQ61051.1 MAG: PHP domain protein [Candidatus Falkowbacteria bacterium GW2011_GWC2_38_22]KKQ63420.1 MAG: PHP domain protein [Candidatus Falkowbacteria bacterium GW2011_GWF1_38_22]KKQ65509.1 MAG: PHP domain protein [Candidatus Falkowbacteria bacterium GW2011_GWE2_38_254]KKQ70184.1 MAG: PHP domain protein [Candidatus Falkowbacteria bacterium GW2011_GWE1_38_31]KKQ72640.1 MAG: PHP domain protein [Candidatus Falkow